MLILIMFKMATYIERLIFNYELIEEKMYNKKINIGQYLTGPSPARAVLV